MPEPVEVANYDALREGLCPACNVELEPQETGAGSFGKCPVCGSGWRLRGDTIEVVIVPDVSGFLRRVNAFAPFLADRAHDDQSDA